MFQNVSLYCLLFFFGLLTMASGEVRPKKDLLPAFDHFETVVNNPEVSASEAYIETLLTTLDGSEQDKVVWEDGRDVWGTGVGITFGIEASLSRMMSYLYNPDIPMEAVVPGIVRRLRSLTFMGEPSGYRQFLSDNAGKDEPIIVRSTYRLAITPDHNSGAYYSYDQKEFSQLSTWKGRRYLLTASLQPESSDVGRKGYPVTTRGGGDIYCYSGEKGLTRMGLGWVDSYIYNSFAITLYLEDAPGSGSVSAISFKWLKAGWLGNNMVKGYHIEKGVRRFAEHLNFFLASPSVPSPKRLETLAEQVNEYGDMALRRVFLEQIQVMVSADAKGAERFGVAYVNSLSRSELLSAVLSNHVVSLLLDADTGSLRGLLNDSRLALHTTPSPES